MKIIHGVQPEGILLIEQALAKLTSKGWVLPSFIDFLR